MSSKVNYITVRKDKRVGRYLATKIFVPKDQVVLDEYPFAIGPKCCGFIVCLECFKPLRGDSKGNRCLSCGWPLCEECKVKPGINHSRWECSVFVSAKACFYEVNNQIKYCPQLDCITPLRVLLAKEEDPERWEKEVHLMEKHEKARLENLDVWNADLVNIAHYLRGPCKLAERFSEQLIMQVVGILEVNAFEARTSDGYPFRCLYPIAGVLAHNCVPNTTRSIYPSEGYKIRLRAMSDLPAGAQLHHSYTYTLDGTYKRQNHLKTGKFFTCTCNRCEDPTELGTHFSSLKCFKCDDGLILAENPLDIRTAWKCTSCDFEISNQAVQKAVSVMQAEILNIQDLEVGPNRLEQCEKLIRKFSSVLHPSHYLNTSLHQNLIEMYGRVQGYEMAELPDVMLERKVDLCRQVLKVLDVFEPGLSRTRAMNLYELHVPLVLLAKRGFVTGTLNEQTLKQHLINVIIILKECVDILQYEDPKSQEGVLCQVARQALNELNLSVEGLNIE